MSISSISNEKVIDSNQLTHSESPKRTPDKIDEFFTKHTTIRRLLWLSPLALAGIVAADKIGPYKLLPQNYMSTWTYAIILTVYLKIHNHASSIENPLQDKKIEHLNS